MKAFTVYQPYALAIVAGLKGYETKSRRTNIRGRVAVHAAKKNPHSIMTTLPHETAKSIYASVYEHFGIQSGALEKMQTGAVIGTVEIVDCVPVEEVLHTLTERERLLGDYSPGRFAWVLQNPIMFDEPFPARGQQGWWEWDEIEACKKRIAKATYQLGLNFFNGVTPGSDFPPADIMRGQVAAFLEDLRHRREVVIGPTAQDITLGDISLDVLPLLPGAFEEISDRGEYSVHQNGKLIGTVRYNGPPEQNTPGVVKIGAETTFIPRQAAEYIEITIDYGKAGENI